MTTVLLGQNRVTLKDSDLLGEGGEARVYRWRELAVKVFHAQALTAAKAAKLRRFPSSLPMSVIAPLELATTPKGDLCGYAMKAIDGAEDFARLSNKKHRDASVPTSRVLALHRSLAESIAKLHAAKVVVGDLNDGNVISRGEDAFLIDADSMQFEGFPCAVGHERFLDPRLYGVDLAAAPRFTAETDWYAFAVMLFGSLLYVHPFGGTHAKYNTLLRRAEARHSALQSDVVLPRVSVTPKALPDDVLHWFRGVFEKDERTPAPHAVLTMTFARCKCGLEHARAVCPDCHALGPLVTRQVLRTKGRCSARTAFETNGRIVAAAMQGGLRYAYVENDVLKREDGSVVTAFVSGSRVAIAGPSTFVATPSGSVDRYVGGKVAERLTTTLRQGVPSFCASTSAAYRQEADWLIDATSGSRVGQVLEGQTWLETGERLGVGFYRAGGFTFAFIVRPGRAGVQRIDGIEWAGRVVEAHAAFDTSSAVLTVVSEAGGVEVVHRWHVSEDAKVLAQSHSGARGMRQCCKAVS